MRTSKDVSVISPVYNEQDNLKELYERIKSVIPSRFTWELIFVDDGSTDNLREVLQDICLKDNRVISIFLSKNYGHQVALTAGYDNAFGRAVISLDSDLQHPPEIIPQMLALWEEKNDIVFARRVNANNLSWFKRTSSKYFYKLMRRLFKLNLVENVADFRLMDQKVVNYFKRYREASRFIRGIVSDIGFKRIVLDYKEDIRNAGNSKYSLLKMIRFALSGIISFSSIPLWFSTFIGMVISLFSIIYACWILCYKILYGVTPGLASVMVGIYFIGGIQLISIGILGEYIANIFNEVKKRPLYCIDKIIKCENEDISYRN